MKSLGAMPYMMALGRFSGDNISERIGSFKLIIFGSLLAIIGYGLVLTNVLIITVIGFGVIGLGLSVIIPEVIRVAGKTKEVSSGVLLIGAVAVFIISAILMDGVRGSGRCSNIISI